jgi:hypothetical protein
MSRNTEFRRGNKYKSSHKYEIHNPSFHDMKEPVKFLEDNYPYENVSMPGLSVLNPGNFPYNIERIFWSHQGENDKEDWLMLALNTDNNFIFYKAACDYTGFDCQGFMKIYVAKDYKDLILYALTERDYEKYFKETTKILNSEIKELLTIKPSKFVGDFEDDERLFISKYLYSLPKKDSVDLSDKPRNNIEYSINFNKYKDWGSAFLEFYITENPYVYKIKCKNENIKLDETLCCDSTFDGVENIKEGFLKSYKKGFKIKIKYIIETSFPYNTNVFKVHKFNGELKNN